MCVQSRGYAQSRPILSTLECSLFSSLFCLSRLRACKQCCKVHNAPPPLLLNAWDKAMWGLCGHFTQIVDEKGEPLVTLSFKKAPSIHGCFLIVGLTRCFDRHLPGCDLQWVGCLYHCQVLCVCVCVCVLFAFIISLGCVLVSPSNAGALLVTCISIISQSFVALCVCWWMCVGGKGGHILNTPIIGRR